MAKRGKIVLQRITDESKRRICQKKRLAGFLKKVNELFVLCGIQAAAIVYTPDQEEPTTWPSDYNDVKKTVDAYLRKPKMEGLKYASSHESFLAEMVRKKRAKVMEMQKRNGDMEHEAILASLLDAKIGFAQIKSEQKDAVLDFAQGLKRTIKEKVQKLEADEQQTVESISLKRKGKEITASSDITHPDISTGSEVNKPVANDSHFSLTSTQFWGPGETSGSEPREITYQCTYGLPPSTGF